MYRLSTATGLTPRNLMNLLRRPAAWLQFLAMMASLLGWPAIAAAAAAPSQAQCYYQNGNGVFSTPINAPAAQDVTFDSVTITLTSPPVAAGNPIGGQRTATASSGTIYIACLEGGTPGGLQPLYGTYDSNNDVIYSPTPGIAFQILRSGTPIPLYATGSLSGNTVTSFTNTTTFQLISTGVLPSNGNQIPAGTVLGEWQFNNVCTKPQVDRWGNYAGCDVNAAVQTVIRFLSGGVTFIAPTCSVSASSQSVSVTLPSIPAKSLAAVGATAGLTRFSINLTGCSANLGVSVTLDTSNPYPTASGVIAPTTGAAYASGVGVQILQSDGATPVTFGTAFPTGSTSRANSSYTFNLYARYYQTATPVTPGQVQATATYTLTYR